MSNYNSLKATINANIKTNGNQEITGSVLNSVLNAMVNTLGAGYQYVGVATPSTNPGSPDAKVFYLAATAGTYANFGNLVVSDNEVAILKWDAAWQKDVTGIASLSQLQVKSIVENSIPVAPYNVYDQNSMINDVQQNLPVGSTIKKVKCASTGTAAPKTTKLVVFDANNNQVSRTEIGTIGTTETEFDVESLGIVVREGYKYCLECLAAKYVSGVSGRYFNYSGGNVVAYNDYYFGFAFVVETSDDRLDIIEESISQINTSVTQINESIEQINESVDGLDDELNTSIIENSVPVAPYNVYDQNSMINDVQQNLPVGSTIKKVKCASTGTAAPKTTKLVVYNENNVRVSRTEIGTIGASETEFDVESLGIVVRQGYKYCIECSAVKYVPGINGRYFNYSSGNPVAYNDYYFGFAFVVGVAGSRLDQIEESIDQINESIGQINDSMVQMEESIEGVEGNFERRISVNLFDKENPLIKNGFYNNRQYTESDGYYVTNPIAVKAGVTYKAVFPASSIGASNRGIAIVDAENNIISFVDGTVADGLITVTPISDGFLSFNVGYGDVSLSSFMVCVESEYPDSYEPYYDYTSIKEGIRIPSSSIPSVLFEKSVIFTGDSICFGETDTPRGYGWARRIGEKNSMSWQNKSVSGGTIMNRYLIGSSFTIADTDFGNGADYIILEGGTNDADRVGSILNGNVPQYYGNWNESDYVTEFGADTFCDAVQRLIQRVVTSFPTAKVGFIIAPKMGVSDNGYDAEHNNRRAYFQTIIEICRKWGVSVLNLWDNCTMNPRLSAHYNESEHGPLYYDGQHPTADGYEMITPIIEKWMETL